MHEIAGEYESAIKEFTAVLKSGPNDTWHHVWFRRELAYYYIYRGKDSFKTYNYDEDLRNKTKHGMSQHESFTVPSEAEYRSYRLYAIKKEIKEMTRTKLWRRLRKIKKKLKNLRK
jgi:hypothetical protein